MSGIALALFATPIDLFARPGGEAISAPAIDYLGISPEAILILGALAILMSKAFLGRRHRMSAALAISALTIAASGIATILLWRRLDGGNAEFLIARSVVLDKFSLVAKLLFLGIAAFALLLGVSGLRREQLMKEEFPALVLLGTTGMMLMAASTDLILTFLALELFSLSFYVLAAFARERPCSQESALKYFLLGSFASAFFLYGVALVYGTVGSTNLADVSSYLERASYSWIFLTAMALLLVGLAFKVGAAPFHMWIPDVYQGAPSQVVGYLAAGAKAAGILGMLRIFVAALVGARLSWMPVIAGLAVVTSVLGAVVALVQADIKRMLAYSSIAHAGYLLMGIAAATPAATAAALFYLVSYAAMVFGAFAIVAVLSGGGDRFTAIHDLSGLARRRPMLATAFTVFLLGLAGIPPTAGFIAKFLLFQAVVNSGLWWLVLVGAITSVIAAYFYLRVIVVMFVREPEGVEVQDGEIDPAVSLGMLLAIGVTFVLGVVPQVLMMTIGSAELVIPGS